MKKQARIQLLKTGEGLQAGEWLTLVRRRKGLKLEDVSGRLKLSSQRLSFLESGEFHRLPPPVYIRGYLREYARLLGLPEKEVLAKYEAWLKGNPRETALFAASPARVSHERFRPLRSLAVASLVVFFLLGAAYIFGQAQAFFRPPALELNSPREDISVNASAIVFSGLTVPEADLTINGQAVYPDEAGGFNQEISLSAGLNVIEVRATNAFGKSSVVTRRILYSHE